MSREMEQSQETRQLKFLRTYWPIILLIGSIVIGWANLWNASARASERITRLEENSIGQQTTQSQIQVQLSQIQTDIQWIKTKLIQTR